MGFFSKMKEKKQLKQKEKKAQSKLNSNNETNLKATDVKPVPSKAEFIPDERRRAEREIYEIPIRYVGAASPTQSKMSFSSTSSQHMLPRDGYDFNTDLSWSYQAYRYRLNMITLE